MSRFVATIGTSPHFRNRTQNGHGHGNAGNMLHAVAARRLVRNTLEMPVARAWTAEELDRVTSDASHILFVGANGIDVGKDHSPFESVQREMAANIRRAKRPVVALGLGAQLSEARVGDDITCPDGTLDLLRTLSEHSETIGVRGPLTAEVLQRLGINNVSVLGCQSCFMSHDPDFADKLEVRAPEDPRQTVGNYSYTYRETPLLRIMFDSDTGLVGQEEFYEWALVNGLPDPLVAEGRRAVRLRRALDSLGIPLEDYTGYLARRFRQFEDIDTWRDWVAGFRFSFGTRFHGNMTALQSGVPALWITHDGRTAELCRLLALPAVPFEEVRGLRSVGELFDRMDLGPFRRAYRTGFARLRDYLDRAALPHNLPPER